MDRLEHKSYRFHLVPGCNRKYISVKMNSTALISGLRKDFRNGLQHTEIFITDGQTYASKPSFFQPYKERTPALTILFHAFRSAKDLPTAILADVNGNGNRNVLDLAPPSCVSGKHHLRKHTDNSRKADGYARSRYAHKPFYSGC